MVVHEFAGALGEYLGPAIPDPEHRLASIAFIKFFLGSGIPTAFEDNEGRMLRALRAIADAGAPLPLQLGVNRGHVFAAEVGIPERGAYTGMGDTTNTAARIMSKAPKGKLYAHPAVLEHSRTRFEVTPAGPFPMKGKAVPLLVYDVGEELGTAEEAAAETRLPLLGRDAELATARGAIEDALAGAGGVLGIVGATGLGKTRLVREALEAVVVDHTIVVRSEPYGSASAYRVLRDPIRGLLGLERGAPEAMGAAMLAALEQVAPDLVPMAPLLADVAQVDVPSTPEVDQLDPQYRPDRLADAVVRLVERALPGRLVLVAEEAHWADNASAQLLGRLAAATAGRPWAVVAVRRADPGGFTPAIGTRITLDPLPPEVIERLVIAATEATPLRPHEIAAVVDRAEGNPLYVEEVTRGALRAGSLEALPESVGGAMSAQIDALPPHSRRILRYCAVLGRSFRLEVLREVLSSDGLVLSPSDVAGLAAFLEPDGAGRMRFRNSLVRDAAYEGLAYKVRARMHRTAGETLERISTDLDADAPMLALHFWRAGDAERTWTYARRAGEEARRAYANVDAAELYERALEVSRRVPGVTDADRSHLWTTLAELRELAGVLEGSVEACRRAAALAPDPVTKAATLARRARVHQRAGAPQTALRCITRARHLLALEPGPEADHVTLRLDNLIALVRLGQESPREARKWALRAAEHARRTNDQENLGSALLAIGHANWQLGVVGQGEQIREAMEIFVANGNLRQEAVARMNLGVLSFMAGRWDEAVQLFQSSRVAAIKAGMDFWAAETDLNIADVLIKQGRLDEAENVLRDALRVLRASGMASTSAYGELIEARLHLARGDAPEADRRAAVLFEEFAAAGNTYSGLEAAILRAEAAIELELPEDALHLIDEGERVAGAEAPALQPQARLVRAGALLQLDRLGEAATAIEAGLRSARDQDLPYEEARLLHLRSKLAMRSGDATEDSKAEADAIRAKEILTEIGAWTEVP